MHQLSSHSDDQLVNLIQQSDESAFTEIYNRYWKSLYTSAHNILHLKEGAQDAVQEVFISLWKRRNAVQIESLKSYLSQAVRFQVFKTIRSEKTDNDFFKRVAMVSQDIQTEDPVLFKELEGLYQQALHSLPPDEQEIFKLHREAGLTYKQIAEQKNISVKTVEKKMSQALKQLRFGLDDTLAILVFTHFFK